MRSRNPTHLRQLHLSKASQLRLSPLTSRLHLNRPGSRSTRPPCWTSSVPSGPAAPRSWTAVPVRAHSASSTPSSCSRRATCLATAAPSTASRCGSPWRRPPCCRRHLLRPRRHPCCPKPSEDRGGVRPFQSSSSPQLQLLVPGLEPRLTTPTTCNPPRPSTSPPPLTSLLRPRPQFTPFSPRGRHLSPLMTHRPTPPCCRRISPHRFLPSSPDPLTPPPPSLPISPRLPLPRFPSPCPPSPPRPLSTWQSRPTTRLRQPLYQEPVSRGQ